MSYRKVSIGLYTHANSLYRFYQLFVDQGLQATIDDRLMQFSFSLQMLRPYTFNRNHHAGTAEILNLRYLPSLPDAWI